MLLLSEQGVEASKKTASHAHAIIKFGRDDTKFEIRDMESKHGTYFCEIKNFKEQVPIPTKDPIFNELKYKATKEVGEVIILDPEPLTLNREWITVSPEDFSVVSVPALVRLGGFVFNITKISSH